MLTPYSILYLAGLPVAVVYARYVARSYPPFARSSTAFYTLVVVLWPIALALMLGCGAVAAVAEPAGRAYERRRRMGSGVLPGEQSGALAARTHDPR